MSKKDGKEQQLKAEYPLNYFGMGYRSTLENSPYFKDDVGYVEPMENYGEGYCGSCAFFFGGKCEALEEECGMLCYCRLYINMASELALRHQQVILQTTSKSEGGDKVLAEKYIAEEDGKYCVRSHQTDRSFGCYRTRAEAEKRLKQISRFKDAEVPEESEMEQVEIEVKFASEGMNEEKRIVYGVVLVPDAVDYHYDTVSLEEVEKAAHKYMRTPMVIGDGHTKKAKANPVESFIYNPEVLKEVKPGSWVMAVKVHSEAIWQGIKDGDYTGFSIGALVRKRPLPVESDDDDEGVEDEN